jgi:cytochrome c553
MKTVIAALVTLIAAATPAISASSPSAERGKMLFNSSSLGTNGKSCATCHPDGKSLGKAAAFDEEKLEKITNQCVVQALKGRAFATGSADLASLVAYIKTFADHAGK